MTHTAASMLLMLIQASGCVYGAVKLLPLWREKSTIIGQTMAVAYAVPVLWAVSAMTMMFFSDRSEHSLGFVINSGVFICFIWVIILFCTVITASRELIAGAAYVVFGTAGNTCLMAGIAHQGIAGGAVILLGYIISVISVAFMILMFAGGWLDRMIASKAKRGRKRVSSSARK